MDMNMDMDLPLLASWTPVANSRAVIYGWLASLFAQELDENQFRRYGQGEAGELLRLLSDSGLDEESQRLRAAIAAFSQERHAFIDLRSDFSQLFLLDGQHSALPYASFYLESDKGLYGEAEKRMRAYLAACGLQVDKSFHEPADHLAVFLALMEKWAREGSAQAHDSIASHAHEQTLFLQEALLAWLPRFVARCQQAPTLDSDFYPALAALLLAFVTEDLDYLQQISQQALPLAS